MKYDKIIIDKKELEVLKQLFSNTGNKKDKTYHLSLQKLLEELKKAKVVDDSKMPIDVIRFNSIVTIKMVDGNEKTFQIVSPEKSNLANNKISIFAPMGLALVGYAEMDTVDWQFPNGISSITIVKVEQPTN